MRIKKVIVQNYRSIRHSGEVSLDGKITTLIGKNEYGKTNFLKALESFGRDYEYKDDDLCTYSEVAEQLKVGSLQPDDIPIVKIWLTIEDEDKQKLEEIHKKLGRVKEFEITKFFNNTYEVESDQIEIASLEPEMTIDVEMLNSWTNVVSLVQSMETQFRGHAERLAGFKGSIPLFEQHKSTFLELASAVSPEEIKEAFSVFINNLQSLPHQDAQIQGTMTQFTNQLASLEQNLLSEMSEKKGAQGDIVDAILDIMPSFLYFTDVDIIEDTVTISEFQSKKEKHKTLDNLFVLASLNVGQLPSALPHKRRHETEIASTVITGLVNNFWRQEKVKVSIGIDGDNLIVFVSDATGALDPPSRRSKGFQWFLSFYINFTVGSRKEFKNTILLLDDPGVYLHPLGQEDLKSTLEELAKTNQIVFATHSPFMVYREDLEGIRIVNKESDRKGTRLTEKYWISDFDALAPLRAALGIKLGDAPFSLQKNLIVEGQEDLLYLEAMVSYFKRTGRKPVIDLSKMLILPANGANKVPFYANIWRREGRRVTVILDYDNKGRQVREELITNLIIAEDKIITIEKAMISYEQGSDVESEDLFAPDFYKHAVSETYSGKISRGRVDLNNLDTSLVKQTKRYGDLFKAAKTSFDKLAVAQRIRLIVDNPACDDKLIGQSTLDSFAKLFEMINGKLR
jgi:predicted ATP-dependent endonuclease of OLD family